MVRAVVGIAFAAWGFAVRLQTQRGVFLEPGIATAGCCLGSMGRQGGWKCCELLAGLCALGGCIRKHLLRWQR